jgi:hypothetical protein
MRSFLPNGQGLTPTQPGSRNPARSAALCCLYRGMCSHSPKRPGSACGSAYGACAPQPPSIGACVPQAPNDRGQPAGLVGHNPRLSGHVCHKPQTTAAARRRPAASRHTINAALITKRPVELAGRSGDSCKMALSGLVAACVSLRCGRRRASWPVSPGLCGGPSRRSSSAAYAAYPGRVDTALRAELLRRMDEDQAARHAEPFTVICATCGRRTTMTIHRSGS